MNYFDDSRCAKGSFYEVIHLSLSSNAVNSTISLYLPNLQYFKAGVESFLNTTSLSISSNSIK